VSPLRAADGVSIACGNQATALYSVNEIIQTNAAEEMLAEIDARDRRLPKYPLECGQTIPIGRRPTWS